MPNVLIYQKKMSLIFTMPSKCFTRKYFLFPNTNIPNFEDDSITQNTRVSYPINHIKNIAKPSLAKNLKIFFLTADAFG